MQQAAFRCDGNNRDCARLTFSYQLRTLHRVNGNITAAADFLTDIQHRRFIHLTFTDNYCTADIYRIECLAHSVDRQLIGTVFITTSYTAAAGNCCSFGNTYELHG